MDFWSEFIKNIISYGVFAMLFVFLLFYQLKDSAKREESYKDTINSLTESLGVLEELKDQVSELVELVKRRENEEI